MVSNGYETPYGLEVRLQASSSRKEDLTRASMIFHNVTQVKQPVQPL